MKTIRHVWRIWFVEVYGKKNEINNNNNNNNNNRACGHYTQVYVLYYYYVCIRSEQSYHIVPPLIAPYVHPFYQCSAEPIGYSAHTIYNIHRYCTHTGSRYYITWCFIIVVILFRSSRVLLSIIISPYTYTYVDYNNNAATSVNVRVASVRTYVYASIFYMYRYVHSNDT